MDYSPSTPSAIVGPLAKFMNSLRRLLKAAGLAATFHSIRRGIHFAPWRDIVKGVIRIMRPVRHDALRREPSLLRNLHPAEIAACLHTDSIAVAGVLPPNFVSRLRHVTDRLAIDHYKFVHEVDPYFRRLAEDPAVLDVLRAYFGCEPELLEATLLITGTHNPGPGVRKNRYHLDYGGWDSLNVMVYLTDVDSDSSCHVVIKGSHRTMTYLDAVRGTISADEAQRRFGAAITEITGPAGLVFFENTEAFHERRCGNKRRVMLNLLYASHRAWFSHGRASQKHLEKRARAFIEVRNAGAAHDAARLEAG